MPTSKDEVVESRNATVDRDEFGNRRITPKALADTAPTEDKHGNTILSQAVRDQQVEQGYAADIQPKAVAPAVTPITGVRGSEEGGAGAMQATGNIVVAAAAQASDTAPAEAAK